jgi:Fur family ferric uptake transcriptional regulator
MTAGPPKRKTQQRKAIELVFMNAERPLSIDDVVSQGREFAPSINQATVYRNLKLLIEDGWLTKIQMPKAGPFYERSGREHHHHFLCRLCNKAFELMGCLLQPKASLAPKGFNVEKHDVILYGTCDSCTDEKH